MSLIESSTDLNECRELIHDLLYRIHEYTRATSPVIQARHLVEIENEAFSLFTWVAEDKIKGTDEEAFEGGLKWWT